MINKQTMLDIDVSGKGAMTPSTDGLCSGGTSGQGKKKLGSKQANR
jgi:hypothetical protein